MSGLETYLSKMTQSRGATVPETAHYAHLQALLQEIGATLSPKVTVLIHPKDTGAGIPDLALFDENQPSDQKPAHGIIEAKPVADDLHKIAHSEQVARYVAHYGQALVTNYYQFILVTRDPQNGKAIVEERYDLAPNATAFWEQAQTPKTLSQKHETALREYLLRVMRRNAPLTSPQDVAWILASYAREAKARIEADSANLVALKQIRDQLESALGVRFNDQTAEGFFRSTLVQTLFYGVFSAWVLWHEKKPDANAKFDLWRDTRRLNIPVISELFAQFSSGSALPYSVEEVLNWTVNALNRVDRSTFFHEMGYDNPRTGFVNVGEGSRVGGSKDAIQYFYEPFLEAFDPELRKQLGVWYTPREVVRYMIARVDTALKEELGIADGLADPNVYILDPCCGTGAFLVEILEYIAGKLYDRHGTALAGQAIQEAIRERIFGFELLPAPFVIAHLQIGIFLSQIKAPLTDGQRAGVYLTNALTGWNPAEHPKTRVLFPELEKEREASDEVKQGREILVIIGNPPYSGFAGMAVDEERELSDAYRQPKHPDLPKPKGQGLNDLYVRFFRMAERRIAEQTKRGVVCFVSNYSWLEGLSHTAMRERYLEAFDKIYIDNLHGDRIIGEYTPDGRTSETIFAVRGNSEGIKVGTSIATLIRTQEANSSTTQTDLYYRDWNEARADERRQALLDSLKAETLPQGYTALKPVVTLGLPFKPALVSVDYLAWHKLTDIFPTYFPGVKTSRDDMLVSIDKEPLVVRMQHFFDPKRSHEEISRQYPSLMKETRGYNPKTGRDSLIKRGYLEKQLVRYAFRPFDVRWVYWESETKLVDEKRPEYFPNVHPDNLWIVSQQKPSDERFPPPVIRSLGCIDIINRSASCIPMYLYDAPKAKKAQLGMFDADAIPLGGRKPNLSKTATAYLDGLGISSDDGAKLLFYHALATLHAPLYRTENVGALRQDWPRLPLPKTRATLEASATLGQQVAQLLDVETPVPHVTQGDPRPDLQSVAVFTSTASQAPDFTVNVRWGYLGQGNTVMPGRGKLVERDGARDIYLNPTTYWANLPQATWDYTLGGYQVLKKWLSYRETSVLGRPLTPNEALEFSHIARRITALISLESTLDANYLTVRSI